MDRIKNQANKLWQILSNPSTLASYQQTLTLTWSILQETGRLVWLIMCLVLVLGDWFWKYSYQAGQNARLWFTTIQTRATSTDESSNSNVLGETSKSLLAAGQASVNSLLNTAKGQLGIETPPEPSSTSVRSITTPAPTPMITESPQTVALPIEEVPEAAAEEVLPEADFSDSEGLLKEPKVPAVEPTEVDRQDL